MALIHAHNMLDELMRNLVTRIAEGEGLDVNELVNKYLGPEAKPIEKTVPKKTRAAKVTVTEATTTKCTAVTAKGKPCRLNALTGTCMCSVHTKKGESTPAPKKSRRQTPTEPEQDEAGPSAPPAPKKKPTKKKVRVPAPEHTHELDDEVHTDCELCQTHGSALAENDTEEFETVMSPRRSLRERLIAVAEEEDNYDDE